MHHEPHPSHLRGDVPLLPTQAELVGPVSLPWPSLSVPNCPSAHLTYLWDLASLCWLPAPSGLLKPRFALCCAQPNCLWATSPSLFKDTVWPPAFHVGWPHHHVSSPCWVSSSLPQGQRWGESLSLWGTGHLQGSLHSGRHQRACWIDLTWGSAWAFCRVLKGSFVLFLGPHIFLCAIGQASPLCYRSCDADRDEALSWSLGCVRLCTPGPPGQSAIMCIMGPIVPLQAWIKCPVCVHACARVQRTPLGDPALPARRAPSPGATGGTGLWPASLSTSRSPC